MVSPDFSGVGRARRHRQQLNATWPSSDKRRPQANQAQVSISPVKSKRRTLCVDEQIDTAGTLASRKREKITVQARGWLTPNAPDIIPPCEIIYQLGTLKNCVNRHHHRLRHKAHSAKLRQLSRCAIAESHLRVTNEESCSARDDSTDRLSTKPTNGS